MSGFKKGARLALLAGVSALLAGVTGCDDPFGLNATLSTEADTVVVFAISGSAATSPAAFNAFSGALVQIEPTIAFDVAFDLTTDNKVRVIPARLISPTKLQLGRLVPTHIVGLQSPSGSYDALTKAPRTGYKRDSVVVVATGQPVVMEVASEACAFSFAQTVYAKLVVDSVNATSRKIFMRTHRDPNCGFRSFLPGIPKD